MTWIQSIFRDSNLNGKVLILNIEIWKYYLIQHIPFTVNTGFKTNNTHISNGYVILSPFPYIISCYLSSNHYPLHNHTQYPYQMSRLFSSCKFQCIRIFRVEPIPKLSNYLEILRMVLKTKHITEHCSHLPFKIHWKRKTFVRRRTADLHSQKSEAVLHHWCPSYGLGANFNPRHLDICLMEPLIPCDSNQHQPHRNLEFINSFTLSNPKLWNFYAVRHANILRQIIGRKLCKCLEMKLRTSLHKFLILLLNVVILQPI